MHGARAARQKPNETCACGSGAKFKRCCGAKRAAAAPAAGAPRLAHAAAPAPGANAAAVPWLEEEMRRLAQEACAAVHAGNWPRVSRRSVSALLLVGDAFCAGAAASDAVAVQLTSRAVGMLSFLAMPDIQRMQLGHFRHDEAEDACLRCLALLTPPHTFWARGLTCLTHAAWRDVPLGANDVRITLAPAVAHAVSQQGRLSDAHRGLATVYTFAQRRLDEAHACLLRALAAAAAEPPSPARQRRRAQVYLDCGNLVGRCEIGGVNWQAEAAPAGRQSCSSLTERMAPPAQLARTQPSGLRCAGWHAPAWMPWRKRVRQPQRVRALPSARTRSVTLSWRRTRASGRTAALAARRRHRQWCCATARSAAQTRLRRSGRGCFAWLRTATLPLR
jgi:hypothetical protein